MVDPGTTAFDPIFWGHPAVCATGSGRIGGGAIPAVAPDSGDILPPWNLTVDDTYSISRARLRIHDGGECFPLTNSATPIQRFQSVARRSSSQGDRFHGRAEFRLHAVQYVARPGFTSGPSSMRRTPPSPRPRAASELCRTASIALGVCIGGPGIE
jgi:hypothetical protein